MLSQRRSKCLIAIGCALLAALFAVDVLLKPPEMHISVAISCISLLFFMATLLVGVREKRGGAIAASLVGMFSAIASFFI
ncbi:hypothetical protein [Collinsella vaginalis]|uniref:hypothetical protein n=1 Tax=Collinsella vaginalis TaxID=1870987 RepID=UPI000A2710D6|nr:hypothetical protein [Collinsella vaginalis]